MNSSHLAQLQEAIDAWQDKRGFLEGELARLSDPQQRYQVQQAIKECRTQVNRLEIEAAELASHFVNKIPEELAQHTVAELGVAIENLEKKTTTIRPEDISRQLEEIRQKLSEPSGSAAGKLKLVIPLIPAVASWEADVDVGKFLGQVWRTIKAMVGGKP